MRGKVQTRLFTICTTQEADGSATSEQQGDDAELEGQQDGGVMEHPSLEGKGRLVHVRRASQGVHAPFLVFTNPGNCGSLSQGTRAATFFPCAISHLTRRPMAFIVAPR